MSDTDQVSDVNLANNNSSPADYKSLLEAATAKHALELSDWQKRHGGLQATYQKEQEARVGLQKELEMLKEQFASTSKGFDAVNTEKQTLAAQLSEKDIAIKSLEAGLKRKSLIMEKYPHLASFEAKNLLPQADPEKLDEVFSAFTDSLKSLETMAAQKHQEGAVPPAPPPQSDQQPSVESLRNLMHEASLSGGTLKDGTTLDQLTAKYMELSKKKS